MEKSRLTNHRKKEALQNILLASAGIIIIIILLVLFGSKLLVGFSILAGKMTKNDVTSTNNESINYIEPPILEPAPEATNSATITISGSAIAEQKISLFLNDKLFDEKNADQKNNFTFTNVTLEDGSNTIKASATDKQGKKSDFSSEIKILRISKEPTLDVNSPSDNQTYKKESSPITITGKTDPGVKITVNDFWGIVDGDGKFTYSYNLKDGDNTIKVQATDPAGNTKIKEIKFRVE